MKYQLQLFYIIHIFQISLKLLEETDFDEKELKKHLRIVKLKFLNSKYKNSSSINNRQVLKLLHLITFEDNLESNTINRSTLNTIKLLKENINKNTKTLVPHTPVFSSSFTETWALNVLYNLFKNKK